MLKMSGQRDTLKERWNSAPVSYTHLDVYKRQIWYWVLSVTGTETFGSFAAIPSGETT